MRCISLFSWAICTLTVVACTPFGAEPSADPTGKDSTAAKTPATSATATTDLDEATSVRETPGAAADEGEAIPAFPGSRLFMPGIPIGGGLVVLHGSEGGMAQGYKDFARKMATEEGFVVVSMCWFGCDGGPAELAQIRLESIAAVGEFVKGVKEARGKVGLFGWERGAEAALVLSSKTNTFDALAVYGSTDHVTTPAWSWDNVSPGGHTKIAVSSYEGPMLLTHGLEDLSAQESSASILLARTARDTRIVDLPGTHAAPGDTAMLRDEVADFLLEHFAFE